MLAGFQLLINASGQPKGSDVFQCLTDARTKSIYFFFICLLNIYFNFFFTANFVWAVGGPRQGCGPSIFHRRSALIAVYKKQERIYITGQAFKGHERFQGS